MIDSRLTKRFASHLKEADKVVMLSSAIRDFDDFGKVGRIFSLDVRVCQRKESEFKIKRKSEILRTNRVLNPQAIQLGLSKSAPNFGPVDFACVITSTVNRHYVLDENIDSHRVLIVLLVDRQRLFI